MEAVSIIEEFSSATEVVLLQAYMHVELNA